MLTSSLTLPQLLLLTTLTLVTTFVYRLIRHRLAWRKLNLPGPPTHSFIWGHLELMSTFRRLAQEKYGPLVHPEAIGSLLSQAYGNGICAIDLWPVSQPMLLVTDPKLCDTIARIDNLPKALDIMYMQRPILSDGSMELAASDPDSHAHWTALRRAFAPAFAKGRLAACTGDVVAETNRLIDVVDTAVINGSALNLNNTFNDATIDIILSLTLSIKDVDFRKRLLRVLESQVESAASVNHIVPMITRSNPFWHLRNWLNTREIEGLLRPEITRHVQARHDIDEKEKCDVLQTALHSHDFSVPDMISQMRTFLFAGSDSTAGTLAWAFYYLYQPQNKSILDKLRQEHDQFLGDAIGDEGAILSHSPDLLNKLTYTTAVIKEALRLCPAASSARRPSDPNYVFSHDGQQYTLKGVPSAYFWLNHFAIHRHPSNFTDAEAFVPERYIDEKGKIATNTDLAWQPFSRGPKNCIGSELAMLEMRVVLVMLVRKYDFDYADEAAPYQQFRLTARPNNGIPMRCRLRATS